MLVRNVFDLEFLELRLLRRLGLDVVNIPHLLHVSERILTLYLIFRHVDRLRLEFILAVQVVIQSLERIRIDVSLNHRIGQVFLARQVFVHLKLLNVSFPVQVFDIGAGFAIVGAVSEHNVQWLVQVGEYRN